MYHNIISAIVHKNATDNISTTCLSLLNAYIQASNNNDKQNNNSSNIF